MLRTDTFKPKAALSSAGSVDAASEASAGSSSSLHKKAGAETREEGSGQGAGARAAGATAATASAAPAPANAPALSHSVSAGGFSNKGSTASQEQRQTQQQQEEHSQTGRKQPSQEQAAYEEQQQEQQRDYQQQQQGDAGGDGSGYYSWVDGSFSPEAEAAAALPPSILYSGLHTKELSASFSHSSRKVVAIVRGQKPGDPPRTLKLSGINGQPWDAYDRGTAAVMLQQYDASLAHAFGSLEGALQTIAPEIAGKKHEVYKRAGRAAAAMLDYQSKAHLKNEQEPSLRSMRDFLLACKLEFFRLMLSVLLKEVEQTYPEGAAALEYCTQGFYALFGQYMSTKAEPPSHRRIDLMRALQGGGQGLAPPPSFLYGGGIGSSAGNTVSSAGGGGGGISRQQSANFGFADGNRDSTTTSSSSSNSQHKARARSHSLSKQGTGISGGRAAAGGASTDGSAGSSFDGTGKRRAQDDSAVGSKASRVLTREPSSSSAGAAGGDGVNARRSSTRGAGAAGSGSLFSSSLVNNLQGELSGAFNALQTKLEALGAEASKNKAIRGLKESAHLQALQHAFQSLGSGSGSGSGGGNTPVVATAAPEAAAATEEGAGKTAAAAVAGTATQKPPLTPSKQQQQSQQDLSQLSIGSAASAHGSHGSSSSVDSSSGGVGDSAAAVPAHKDKEKENRFRSAAIAVGALAAASSLTGIPLSNRTTLGIEFQPSTAVDAYNSDDEEGEDGETVAGAGDHHDNMDADMEEAEDERESVGSSQSGGKRSSQSSRRSRHMRAQAQKVQDRVLMQAYGGSTASASASAGQLKHSLLKHSLSVGDTSSSSSHSNNSSRRRIHAHALVAESRKGPRGRVTSDYDDIAAGIAGLGAAAAAAGGFAGELGLSGAGAGLLPFPPSSLSRGSSATTGAAAQGHFGSMGGLGNGARGSGAGMAASSTAEQFQLLLEQAGVAGAPPPAAAAAGIGIAGAQGRAGGRGLRSSASFDRSSSGLAPLLEQEQGEWVTAGEAALEGRARHRSNRGSISGSMTGGEHMLGGQLQLQQFHSSSGRSSATNSYNNLQQFGAAAEAAAGGGERQHHSHHPHRMTAGLPTKSNSSRGLAVSRLAASAGIAYHQMGRRSSEGASAAAFAAQQYAAAQQHYATGDASAAAFAAHYVDDDSIGYTADSHIILGGERGAGAGGSSHSHMHAGRPMAAAAGGGRAGGRLSSSRAGSSRKLSLQQQQQQWAHAPLTEEEKAQAVSVALGVPAPLGVPRRPSPPPKQKPEAAAAAAADGTSDFPLPVPQSWQAFGRKTIQAVQQLPHSGPLLKAKMEKVKQSGRQLLNTVQHQAAVFVGIEEEDPLGGGGGDYSSSASRSAAAADKGSVAKRLYRRWRPPILEWIAEYNWQKHFMKDLTAGITIGIVLIPQGLAYATVSGEGERGMPSAMPSLRLSCSYHLTSSPFPSPACPSLAPLSPLSLPSPLCS